MFDTLSLKIFFHSRHLSLKDACDAVTRSSLAETIIECDRITRGNAGFDCTLPLAVAALNPHASDGGLFGDEERIHITPAIEDARAMGIDVFGPIGADSVFHQALMGRWRAVISLYHDQGHIAAKTYDFNQTISVTWGLPFLRTSVDHGTAFDIAGRGIADESGMVRAIEAQEYPRGSMRRLTVAIGLILTIVLVTSCATMVQVRHPFPPRSISMVDERSPSPGDAARIDPPPQPLGRWAAGYRLLSIAVGTGSFPPKSARRQPIPSPTTWQIPATSVSSPPERPMGMADLR